MELLTKQYPSKKDVKNEILKLNADLYLPKGTEFFFSDLHGEYDAFIHLLRSASGVIKNKIDLLFPDYEENYRQKLAHMIYYPENNLDTNCISDLIELARFCSKKYNRDHICSKIPENYRYMIMELLSFHDRSYQKQIIDSLKKMNLDEDFFKALCTFIRHICIDTIHIIGDIFDRGPRPDKIIDELMKYDDVDIQWGNHDISWMGAASGHPALIANVIRIALSYDHFDLLEDGYGINLRVLSDFAKDEYAHDPCHSFYPYTYDDNHYDHVDPSLCAKMHKAITLIQLKLEGQIKKRHPEWKKDLDYLKTDNKLIFPTVDIQDPYKLTQKEEELIKTLTYSFLHSERLQKHISYLYQKGSMYAIRNGNLLFHGCIPMKQNGHFRKVKVDDQFYEGKDLLDCLEKKVINAYYQKQDLDIMWFLWCTKDSPLYGKSHMNIYEKYFLDHSVPEILDPYYNHVNNEKIIKNILKHFGLNEEKGHIINGHVPVKSKEGESPVKANGRLLVIDGGISKAYHLKTGTAGYTLIYDSQHLQLAKHLPFHSFAKEGLMCLTPEVEIIESYKRILNIECDQGKDILLLMDELFKLLNAYQSGMIKEYKIMI